MTNRAQQFREQIEEHTLPGRGMTVLLRRPDISALIMEHPDGDVPSALTAQLLDSLKAGAGKARKNGKGPQGWDIGAEDLPQVSRFINLLVRAALISPRIADEPDYDADEIAVADLTGDERLYIFTFAFPQAQQVAAAGRFPGEQVAGVDAVADGEGVQPEAVEFSGD
jgi:hypothetical protein